MITLDRLPPVTVATSPDPETRWGYFQFPKLSRLPDQSLLLTFNACPDDDLCYGAPSPAWCSRDAGRTWAPFIGEAALTVSHSPVSAVLDGEYLGTPFPRALDARTVALPPAVGQYDTYGTVSLYDLRACPAPVRDYLAALAAWRWTPGTGWHAEMIAWDTEQMLVRCRDHQVPRTSFQYPLRAHGHELLYAEYVSNYYWPGGQVPRGMTIHLMVSNDNGHRFTRRSVMFADPAGHDHFGEADLAVTPAGHLVSVVRRSIPEQRPLAVSRSTDGGYTWTAPVALHQFGVLPNLLALANGVLVLSFGRPGVWLAFSPDGEGVDWTAPEPVLAGDPRTTDAHSCGYTALLPLGPDSFLLAYSDFQPAANHRKAIKVQQFRVTGLPA